MRVTLRSRIRLAREPAQLAFDAWLATPERRLVFDINDFDRHRPAGS